jgi:hypothetical protein
VHLHTRPEILLLYLYQLATRTFNLQFLPFFTSYRLLCFRKRTFSGELSDNKRHSGTTHKLKARRTDRHNAHNWIEEAGC